MKIISPLFLILAVCFPANLFAQEPIGDIAKGEKIYKRCAVCHLINENKNRVGPSLQNILHRKAGSLPNFRYSPAMIKAGENGLIWDKDTLKEFLLGPQAMIKGNRMANIRFSADENITDLIAYILQISPSEKKEE